MRLPMPVRRRRGRPVPAVLPTHVGVVMDGNRRWARAVGLDPRLGHRAGADHIEDLLGWAAEWGVEHLTVYVLSADNIRKRSTEEVDNLFGLLAERLPNLVLRSNRWALHVSGDLSLLSPDARTALADAEQHTAGRPSHLTMAIGYDGRADIVDGVRGALREKGADVTEADITAHLRGGPVKEIDLVVRTSGEQRTSGFFPWQSAGAEIFVSPKMWPAFGADDFTAALCHFSDRRA